MKELMTEKVIACAPDAPVSQLISQMRDKKIHQIPVIGEGDKYHEKGEVIGIVTVNKIVTKEFDPANVHAKTVMLPTAKISPNDTVERAVELILGANLRALPVWGDGLEGIISEQDIMKVVNVGGMAKDVMQAAATVEESDNVGKVKEIIVQKNFSRVVVKHEGRVTDVVGTMDLMRILQPGQQSYPARASPIVQGTGRGYKEKQQLELQARISRIENNIHPILQIEDEEVPTYSIEGRLKELRIPGLSIAVVTNGKVKWAKGYGIADKSEDRMVTPSPPLR